MIKVTAKAKDGSTMLFLGLTPENLERLKDDQPILVNGTALSLPGLTIAIFVKDTEVELVRYLREQGLEFPADAEAQAAMLRAPKKRQ